TQGGFTGVLGEGDNFGTSVAWLGDLGPGAPTPRALAVGAMHYVAGDTGTNHAAVWILFLEADATVHSFIKIKDGAGGFTDALVNNNQFGRGLGRIGTFA